MQLAQTLEKLTPFWKREIEKALALPPLPLDYQPKIVEIFDDLGLLAGSVLGEPYQCHRPEIDLTNFIAWYLDGQLVFFYLGDSIVIDRLTLMAKASNLLNVIEGG
ncbi:hypothetical protein H6S82_00110 [Planktothrix sp. FACHB-1355]|uniref:Uncharacterized protein n=1 Tax=Aerosakkonema funiforme FACHB-1375 TaxID=2949571 RepID=A0A926VDL6_9CYAN|nr:MULTISPECIES: hypothetical protein [Oscillatoriales]MBD2181856.1 hypothetical protein [Aerosakkonema funiforme FACHB-1375]MBD3557276.1 hypothetical protein [Planktothrix sp. FACHB-1355]